MIRAYSLKADGKKQLTRNFRVQEFACKDGSDTVFIDIELPLVLQSIREIVGKPVVISSAFRTWSHNQKYVAKGKASPQSQHLYGRAADIHVTGVDPEELAGIAERLLGDGGGIGIYPWGIHVDTRDVRSRWDRR